MRQCMNNQVCLFMMLLCASSLHSITSSNYVRLLFEVSQAQIVYVPFWCTGKNEFTFQAIIRKILCSSTTKPTGFFLQSFSTDKLTIQQICDSKRIRFNSHFPINLILEDQSQTAFHDDQAMSLNLIDSIMC